MEDISWSMNPDSDGFVIERFQEIPAELTDRIKAHKANSVTERARELHWAGSVPAILVVKWRNEGFDVFREPVKAIIARLKREGYEDFIATNKRI